MNDVEIAAGKDIPNASPFAVFSEESLAFLSDLSNALLKGRDARAYPDVASVGFWCRRANIDRLASQYADKDTRIGRGLAFHIAPSNIPVSFAFTLFFGILSGCSNIVRLPSRAFPQVAVICGAIARILPDHPEIESKVALVRYPRGSGSTARFCASADCRVIWGGDATVTEIRAHPTRPRCVDICFADRYSICVIDGSAVDRASDAELRRAVDGFYNDTFLMDQNACSSPQTVIWINDSSAARDRFWSAVADAASARYTMQPMTSIDKYSQMCADAIAREEVTSVMRTPDGSICRAELSSIPKDWDSFRGVGGYFYECAVSSLDDIADAASDRSQTATYFGIDAEELRRALIRRRASGIDRIVPMGSALDISLMWDGFDIIRTMSRAIDAR